IYQKQYRTDTSFTFIPHCEQRSYYRCSQLTCSVKKQVQRLSSDAAVVVTTYEGVHNHPCEILMETLSPLLNQMQFLSQF
ncbi:probable WRKY transcription factor 43, partial [Phalaenopsis equestris]|uniref:probable WRKY transcription factor 43 n=1 Tax=Phalaenopsis equestris TaxID=78828 RepID=UPI0009E5D117